MAFVVHARSAPGFRQRFLAGETLLGTFIKTPSPHTTEILGGLGFDFVVIDEEHAPFDRVSIDTVLLACRAAGTAGIVRVAESSPARILAALDDGAAGVMTPHLTSVAAARQIAQACRYRNGKRGFSNSPRAGGYGSVPLAQHVTVQDNAVTVIGMIEDPEAVDAIADIAAVEGIDGFFVGRGDLAVALGETAIDAPAIEKATRKIIAAARAVGKPVCIMVATADEADAFLKMGASAFLVSSDQGFLRQAALKALAEFAPLRGATSN
jgi:2-keto-3-deoxy-L-rhamnonate aldolase RhmA